MCGSFAQASTDPQAVWVYQSYPWHQFIYYHKAPGGGDPINLTRALSRAWTSAVPKGKLLLLDLWADAGPLWRLLDSFFGHDFIWCMLHSFGGNDGMWADLRTVSREPVLALQNSKPGSLQGFSVTPEGIDQNWIAYELMLETPWREQPLSPSELSSWVDGYAHRRGHGISLAAQARVTSAWRSLAASVYNLSCASPADTPHNSSVCPAQREPGLGFHALNRQPTIHYGSLFYKAKPLVAAWGQLLQAAATATTDADNNSNAIPSTLRHDLVDVSREALAAVSDIIASDVHRAIAAANAGPVRLQSQRMDSLIAEMDTLLGTDRAFLLGPWVQDARGWGHDARETALYSFNAKYLITGWSFHYFGRLPGTGDYAARMWNGLLGTYYRARWALYGQMAVNAIVAAGDQKHEWPNMTAWAIAEDNLTDSWAHAAGAGGVYPTSPSGDAVALSQAAYTKYSALLLGPPPLPPAPPTPPSNSTPAGYEEHVGGYWKRGMKHGGAEHTVATCATACTVESEGCVAFELSATRVCYMFSSTSGDFIKNPGCRTFTKIHAREK